MTRMKTGLLALTCAALLACGSAPETADEHLMKAMQTTVAGDVTTAMKHYDAALALDPDDTSCWVARGAAHDMNGDAAAALADYEKVLELDPSLEPGLRMAMQGLRERL